MCSLEIQNPEVDREAAQLLTEAHEAMTPQWQKLLPKLTIILSRERLGRVPELSDYFEVQNASEAIRHCVQIVCMEFDRGEATLWVAYHRNSVMHPRDYYFKKELYELLAQLIWVLSDEVRTLMRKYSSSFIRGNAGMEYIAFRDTFSRFFLNPEWLQEERATAWHVLSALDQELALA